MFLEFTERALNLGLVSGWSLAGCIVCCFCSGPAYYFSCYRRYYFADYLTVIPASNLSHLFFIPIIKSKYIYYVYNIYIYIYLYIFNIFIIYYIYIYIYLYMYIEL